MDCLSLVILVLAVIGSAPQIYTQQATIETISTEPNFRLLKGVPREHGIFLGGNQSILFYKNSTVNNVETDIGVCYSDSDFACNGPSFSGNQNDCDNYIRDVTVLPYLYNCTNPSSLPCRLYFSGTNALYPRSFFCNFDSNRVFNCSFEENATPNNDTCLDSNIDGTDVFQYTRDTATASLYLNNKIFFGTNQSKSDGKSIIGMTDLDASGKPTVMTVHTRLDTDKQVVDAEFVGEPFEKDGYVYFLFRENAEEYESLSFQQGSRPGKIFSRIARVCANDDGTASGPYQILTSYLKQRLVCYQETNDAGIYVNYDEIQDFEYDSTTDTIYAIFTSSRNAASMSAMCTFDLSDIKTAFNSSGIFFGSTGDSNIWSMYSGTPAISKRPGADCTDPNTSDLNFMRDYALVKRADGSDAESPTSCIVSGDRFTDMDRVNGDYFIVSSASGYLYNISADCNSSVDISRITVENLSDKDIAIRDIAILQDDSSKVVATTKDSVVVIDLMDNVEIPPTTVPPLTSSLNGTEFTVQASAEFEIIVQCNYVCDNFTVKDSSNVFDLPNYLWKSEFLDGTNPTVRIMAIILQETVISFTTDYVITISPIYNYTDTQVKSREAQWEVYNNTHTQLNDTCKSDTTGNFPVTVISTNHSDLTVEDCDACIYGDSNCFAPTM